MGRIRVESWDTLLENDRFPPRVLNKVANMLRSRSRERSRSRKRRVCRAHVVPMCSWRVEAHLICIYLFLNGVLTSTHGHQETFNAILISGTLEGNVRNWKKELGWIERTGLDCAARLDSRRIKPMTWAGFSFLFSCYILQFFQCDQTKLKMQHENSRGRR